MSESSFPFQGGTAVADAPPVPLVDEVVAEGNRSRVLLLAGGAGVVVLAVVAYFLFFTGGGSDPAASAPVKHGVVPSVAAPAPAVPVVKQHHISTKSFGRDPFKALISDTPAAVAPATSVSTGTPTTGGTGTTSGSTTTGTTTGTGTTAGTGTTTPTVTAPHTFRVVNVSADQSHVTVRVDGKDYPNLEAGQVFATYFKVIVIGGKVNGFQFGDERFSVFGTKVLYIAA